MELWYWNFLFSCSSFWLNKIDFTFAALPASIFRINIKFIFSIWLAMNRYKWEFPNKQIRSERFYRRKIWFGSNHEVNSFMQSNLNVCYSHSAKHVFIGNRSQKGLWYDHTFRTWMIENPLIYFEEHSNGHPKKWHCVFHYKYILSKSTVKICCDISITKKNSHYFYGDSDVETDIFF